MEVSNSAARWRWQWVFVGMTIWIAFVLASSSTAFAKGYILDPDLSLTGGCTPVGIDPLPDPECPGGEHPAEHFTSPRSITTDFYGDIYVASYGTDVANGKEGRIDVFSPNGIFITELAEPEGPKDLAVDSKGNLYVYNAHSGGGNELRVFAPSVYEPLVGKIIYGNAPNLITSGAALNSIAITPSNDHLFFKRAARIVEYSSAAEGNKELESIGEGSLSGSNGEGLAIDEAHNRIYAGNNGNLRIFKLEPPHTLLDTIIGSDIPGGELTVFASLGADETTGRFFVFDGSVKKKAYEFEFDKAEEAKYLETIKVAGKDAEFASIFGSEIGVDNGPFSPNSGFAGLESSYLFVPSEEGGIGQALAFAPFGVGPPTIESISFADITEEDAELQAVINPEGLGTHYTFEYTTQANFENEGFANAVIAGEGDVPVGKSGVEVSAAAIGLAPETVYRFRVVAENEEGEREAEKSFTTYPPSGIAEPCPNEAARTGLSALLPDCRAYELVTPPDTNARTPRGLGLLAGTYFPTRESSPTGDKASFATEGGTIPGNEGTGSILGDPYLATRGPNGWSTVSAGPNGVEAVTPEIGSTSPDQGYSFWSSNGPGSASIEGKSTSYVRYPDGHSELVGRGSLTTDPAAQGKLISEDADHIIFISSNSGSHVAVQLEPNAPPSGTAAVYDHKIDQETGEEETHVISLLPGNVTPSAGQNAEYKGASLDGKGVAFAIGKKLYLRYNNEETYEVGENATFAGVAEGGAKIFYLEGGDLYAFDAKAEETIRFTESGDVVPVNVAAEGTAAYFVSPTVLTGEENPNGAKAQVGKENLYLSREGAISFVGTVLSQDIKENGSGAGLGLWVNAASTGRFGEEASRSTPEGNALLFESRAALDDYNPEGHTEIYRYDSDENTLQCLSCSPTQASAASDASLQSNLKEPGGPEPFSSFVLVHNLRSDGRRAFFQSSEPLVSSDTDGLQDVYEWEAQGIGNCKREGGCIYLISSGRSDRLDYLYAVSDNGDNVFFRSSDLLLPIDTERTPSIYDARVGGGFLDETECMDPIFCFQKPPPSPPILVTPTSTVLGRFGNLPRRPSRRPCPKDKHRITKNGKTKCVKKTHRKHKGGSKKKGAGK